MALLFHNAGGTCRAGSGGTLRGQSGWVCVCELVSGWACKLEGVCQTAVPIWPVPEWVKLERFQDSCGKRRKAREKRKRRDRLHMLPTLQAQCVLVSWVWMWFVRGCSRRREREKGVYLEKSWIKWKCDKTIRAEEVVESRLCVCEVAASVCTVAWWLATKLKIKEGGVTSISCPRFYV